VTRIDPLIAIGLPTWGKVSISWAQAYRHLGGPLGANTMELAPVVGRPIAEARNELMEAAIQNGADFLFMIGDDVLCPGDTIIRMLQRMWDNPQISMITGMYWTKGWPTQPYIWKGIQRGPYLDWKYGEFFQIDFAGCDCLLIRLSDEIKQLGPDWFSTSWRWNAEDNPMQLATEDFYFYTKAREAGIKLYCDSTIQCIHEDRNSGMQFALTSDMPQYTNKDQPWLPDPSNEDGLVRVADVGCGFTTPWFGTADKVKVVRFDTNEKAQPDYRCDIRQLPVPDQSFDVVHSKHVLEHFGRDELFKTVREWVRILRVGGEFRLSVPNLLHAMTEILAMEMGAASVDPYPFWQLYGQQLDQYDVHKNGFTPKRVKMLLEMLGFEDIEVSVGNAKPNDGHNTNIFARGIKVKHDGPEALMPSWDIIREAEQIAMKGITSADNSVEPVKVRRPRTRETLAGISAAANGTGAEVAEGQGDGS
jgi:predicted SAM-dependent methyltransferase